MSVEPKLFKQVRLALALTQQELADALGISRVTVNKMERGRLRRGIPDEIGARLLNLRTAARDPDKPTWPCVAWQRQQNDAHLWDNEEDDQ